MSTMPLRSAKTLTRSLVTELKEQPDQERSDIIKVLIGRVRTHDLDCPNIGPFKVLLNLARALGIEIPDEEDLVTREEESSLQRFLGQDTRMRNILAFSHLSWEKRNVGYSDIVAIIRLPAHVRISDPQVLNFLHKFQQAIDWPLVIQIGETEVFAKPDISKDVLNMLLQIGS